MRCLSLALVLVFAVLFGACAAPSRRLTGEEPRLLESFDFSDPAAWIHGRGTDGRPDRLELSAASAYSPSFRSPLSIALWRDVEVEDFTLEADLLQTGREYGHRDLCLFFGFVDPAHFYYAHLASQPDDHAHNLFLVDGADRRRLAPVPARGVQWGTDRWHRVRLERGLGDGSIRLWLDGELVLEARDSTFGRGRVGFGSFDDSGAVRRIELSAPGGVRVRTTNPFRGS